jgi:Fic family protein
MQDRQNVQSTIVSLTAKDGRNEAAQLVALRSFFASIDHMRASLNLDVEEMLLYLGVGYLNTERIQQIGSNGYITSTNVSSVADFMKIPKETARRKIKRLIALGLIENKRGVVVSDVTRWFAFVRQMPLCTHNIGETERR